MVNTIEAKPSLADIAGAFFKIGAVSYGGPAIMGIMQAEIQEKRKWVDKEKFVEGLAVVNLLPGPLATQLAIFLGHETGGIVGGIVAGVCFIVPAFVVMLVLSSLYVTFGALPSLQHAFYGIGPVVIGMFAVAVYRLGKKAIKEYSQIAIAVVVAAIVLFTPAGLVATLLAAGCAGLALFYSWRVGLISFLVLVAAFAAFYLFGGSIGDLQAPAAATGTGPDSASLSAMGIFFLKVGAFTFGGGFTMLAFIQEQVVNQFGWLTTREFVDGLALGQLTPGPVLSLAAFVGYKLFGTLGAAVAITMIFLPSFLMILTVLPLLGAVKDLQWLKAFMRGVSPAVIGTLAVALVQMAPHAAPDIFTWGILVLTIVLMLMSKKLGTFSFMAGGATIGLLTRGRAWELLLGLIR